ncbi:hypothetical protein U1Q18_044765 [Sarracenia purpurea var. burkii]
MANQTLCRPQAKALPCTARAETPSRTTIEFSQDRWARGYHAYHAPLMPANSAARNDSCGRIVALRPIACAALNQLGHKLGGSINYTLRLGPLIAFEPASLTRAPSLRGLSGHSWSLAAFLDYFDEIARYVPLHARRISAYDNCESALLSALSAVWVKDDRLNGRRDSPIAVQSRQQISREDLTLAVSSECDKQTSRAPSSSVMVLSWCQSPQAMSCPADDTSIEMRSQSISAYHLQN